MAATSARSYVGDLALLVYSL